MGATFLVCHGAWSAGWAWKKMHPLMAAAGHRLVTPTYTGLASSWTIGSAKRWFGRRSSDSFRHLAGAACGYMRKKIHFSVRLGLDCLCSDPCRFANSYRAAILDGSAGHYFTEALYIRIRVKEGR
jgi:hypothetical protein